MAISKQSLFSKKQFVEKLAASDSPLPVFKAAIKNAREELKQHYLAKASASDLTESLTWFMDEMVCRAWKLHKDKLAPNQSMALVAVGGYGRGELHPYSDIDIQILLETEDYEKNQLFTEEFVRFLWDIGLEVGQSLRSIKDCIKESKADITVMTNLLESRFLLGDKALFDSMDEAIRNPRVWPSEKFFQGKFEEQTARHKSYNDTAYNLEPNLKEGPGGLRDLQTILWVYNRHYGCRNYNDLRANDFLRDEGIRNFVRNRNFLWKIRFGLHFLSNRREDRLLFDHQRSLAAEYGYEDNEKHLAVEQLMQRYYQTVKDISLQNEILLERYRLENTSKIQWMRKPKIINKRFSVRNNTIEMSDENVFKESSYALLEIFLMMQIHEIDNIHPDTIRAIRYNLSLINKKFRNDIRSTSLFIDIFRHPTGLTRTLRRMNNYGVLGAYLPAWGNIVGQMQHDLFHVYTVDAHTLMVVHNLRRLTTNQNDFPLASELMNGLYKPQRLYLGALFHDIAKGRGGDHSTLGAIDARDFCLHHQMSEYDANLVAWLVDKHLYMSHFSQRRDISDPEVVQEFANEIGDREHLDNLYLLTMADIRGTSPKVWNAWKGQLLQDLYLAARNTLRRGAGKSLNIAAHIDDDKNTALAKLRQSDIAIDKVQHFWNTLSDEYFLRYTPDDIVWHVNSINEQSILQMPIIAVRYSKRYEANQFFILAAETNWLVNEVTGAFDQADIDIFEACINSTTAGFGLYTFTTRVPEPELAQEEQYLTHLVKELHNSMLFGQNNRDFKRSFVSRALKHFPIKASVNFIENNDNHTMMEVIAQDQKGLLNKVAQALLKYNIRLNNARISTFGERAEDIFFISKQDGSPDIDKAILDKLSADLCKTLDNEQDSA